MGIKRQSIMCNISKTLGYIKFGSQDLKGASRDKHSNILHDILITMKKTKVFQIKKIQDKYNTKYKKKLKKYKY